ACGNRLCPEIGGNLPAPWRWMRHVIDLAGQSPSGVAPLNVCRIGHCRLGLSVSPVRPEIRIASRKPGWLNQVVVNPDIKQFGLGVFSRLAPRNLLTGPPAPDTTSWVIQIAREDSLSGTYDYTGGFEVDFNPV